MRTNNTLQVSKPSKTQNPKPKQEGSHRGTTEEAHGANKPAFASKEHARTDLMSVLLPLMFGAVRRKSPRKSKEFGTASPRGSQ